VSDRHEEVQAWLATRPPLSALRERFPADWEAVQVELTRVVATGDPATVRRYVEGAAPAPPGGDRTAALVRRHLAAAALRGHYLAEAADVKGGRIRFGLVNGYVAQRLLFARGLERKPVSLRRFRLTWPLLTQRRRLLPLVQPKGIYCFYSGALVSALASLIDGRTCLEIAAGDGTLARFLRTAGVPVTATDDGSWGSVITYPADVVRQGAREALRAHAPAVVLCSWPPAGNPFERHVFATRSVELYVMIGSRHEFAAGDWRAYRSQTAFTWAEEPALSRLVLPPELDAAVYVFRRSA
jgi:hypothetical protein